MMRVSMEPLPDESYILRIHPSEDGDWKHRSPYTWCCTVTIENGAAELKGVTKPPTAAELAALKRYFREARHDIHTVWWERANGTVFTVSIERKRSDD